MGLLVSSICPDRENHDLGLKSPGVSLPHYTYNSDEECSRPETDQSDRMERVSSLQSSPSTVSELPPSTLSGGEVAPVLHLLMLGTGEYFALGELDCLVIGKAVNAKKAEKLVRKLGFVDGDCVIETLDINDGKMHNIHAIVRYNVNRGFFVLQSLPQSTMPSGANKNGMHVKCFPSAGSVKDSGVAGPSRCCHAWKNVSDIEHVLIPGEYFACNWKDACCHIAVMENAQIKQQAALLPSARDIVARLAPCVVRVALCVYDSEDESYRITKIGSGMVVHPEGLILTASHLIMSEKPPHALFHGWPRDAAAILVGTFVAEALPTVWTYLAELANEPESLRRPSGFEAKPWLDIAVLKIVESIVAEPAEFVALAPGGHPPISICERRPPPVSLPAAPLGDSRKLRLGDKVTLLGYPAQHGATSAFAFDGSVNAQQDGHLLTTAVMKNGASGGGCISATGEVIGIQSHSFRAGDYAYARLAHLADALLSEAIQKYHLECPMV